MKILNWKTVLASAKVDTEKGVRMVPVTSDPIFRMFVIEILPQKTSVAQFHYDGTEIYLIMQGYGLLHTAMAQSNMSCDEVKTTKVVAGDCFNIYPGIAHQLENTSNEPLIVVFSCPVNHLSLDRVLVSDLKKAGSIY